MTLLTVVQNACLSLGINKPNEAVTSYDKQILKLVAYANKGGKEIIRYPAKDAGWSFLRKSFSFNSYFLQVTASTTLGSNILTLADTTGIIVGYGVTGLNIPAYAIVTAVTPTTVTLGNIQNATATGSSTYTFSQISYDLPVDYSSLIPNTYFPLNNTQWYSWQITPAQAQWIKARNGLYAGFSNRFMIQSKSIILDPYPQSVNPYSLLYRSNAYVIDGENQNYKTEFTKDVDTTLIDEELLTESLIWRFKADRGLPYDEDYNIYENHLSQLAGEDGGGGQDIIMGSDYLLNDYYGLNIAEGSWGYYGG